MRALQRLIHTHLLTNPIGKPTAPLMKSLSLFPSFRPFSSGLDKEADWSSNFKDAGSTDEFGWDAQSSLWSTGLTKEHFDGEVVGRQIGSDRRRLSPGFGSSRWTDEELNMVRQLKEENLNGKAFADGWDERMREISVSVKLVRESRGSYLKDSKKAEMYKKHKENPHVYTIESLAKEYGIMRQRVHAILWLKELEEEEEKKLGCPLDDSIEVLLDTCPEFFNSDDREFQLASIPYKPDFKVMPEGWDGTTRDPDEVHYETSTKEDEMLYQDFVQRFNFNKMKMAKRVKCHKYNRRHSAHRWNYTDEKSRPPRKFMSIPDGSSRPLDDLKKIFVKSETPRRRRKILL